MLEITRHAMISRETSLRFCNDVFSLLAPTCNPSLSCHSNSVMQERTDAMAYSMFSAVQPTCGSAWLEEKTDATAGTVCAIVPWKPLVSKSSFDSPEESCRLPRTLSDERTCLSWNYCKVSAQTKEKLTVALRQKRYKFIFTTAVPVQLSLKAARTAKSQFSWTQGLVCPCFSLEDSEDKAIHFSDNGVTTPTTLALSVRHLSRGMHAYLLAL